MPALVNIWYKKRPKRLQTDLLLLSNMSFEGLALHAIAQGVTDDFVLGQKQRTTSRNMIAPTKKNMSATLAQSASYRTRSNAPHLHSDPDV